MRDRMWHPEPDTDFEDFGGTSGPKKLMFTLTGKCNLRCAHCARGVYEIAAQETPDALVDHVIERLMPTLRAVRLGGTDLGEQLLSRNFDRFLEAVLAHPGLELELITNLTVLNPQRAELIARACREFAISLEGVGDFFEATRGFPYARFLDNLRLIDSARRAAPQSSLRIIAMVTCYHDNLDQLERILALCEAGIDEFRFQHFRPNRPDQVAQALESHRALSNEAFAALEARGRERGLHVETPPPFEIVPLVESRENARRERRERVVAKAGEERQRWTCHFPFEAASIFSDGEVAPCCERIVLGKLDPQAPELGAIFSGDAWRELRRQVSTWEFHGACVGCQFKIGRIAEAGAGDLAPSREAFPGELPALRGD